MTRQSATRIVAAGVVAGTVATAVQFLAWEAGNEDAVALLWRDSRLAAAMVLGRAVLTSDSAASAIILLAAVLVHFGLSVLFAALLRPFAGRWSSIAALPAGGAFGALLYVLNLHGLTVVFPWFTVSRGTATFAAHVAFGISAMAVLRMRPPVAR